MIISFRLPDSTLVYLNSGSVLKYPSIFTGNIREVSLNGEAYFEVAKDPEHKFIVSTPQKSKVEVLGTHFNLEAFDEMDEVITTLVEGKVEFVYEKDGQGSKILMRPGQKVIYNNKDGQILSYNTNGESELAWMDQKIIFDKTPFKAALHILKKRYNVDFIVNTSKFDKYTYEKHPTALKKAYRQMFPHPACMRKPLTCLNTNRENYFLTLIHANI